MKKSILVITVAIVTFLSSCGDKKKTASSGNTTSSETTGLTVNDDEGKSGNFSVDGTSFKGKSSTQYFGDKVTGQFSVLCQQDEPFALLQAVFANEAAATGNLKPADGFYSMETGEAHIALSGNSFGDKEFVTTSSSTGSIIISGKELVIKDLKLYNSDKQEKTVSATIPF